ncbi:endopeptidase La [Porphyromonas sp. COT-108 OH1349]|uniref:endopeptidase La n=1 Tax=Porphyromonas sp. COT-108 OH1349 TaxID=1537504 RepID=UPI00068EC2E3|nr:endopeptidase La [Porphyromonas sp. COT-108 OH1349]
MTNNMDDLMEEMEPSFSTMHMVFPDEEMDKLTTLPENIPLVLPVLPLQNTVLYPNVTVPVMNDTTSNPEFLKYLEESKDKHVIVVTQKNRAAKDPKLDDLMPIAVIAEVMRVLDISEEGATLLVMGKKKVEINTIIDSNPILTASYTLIDEIVPPASDMEYKALIPLVQETTMKVLLLGGEMPKPMIKSFSELKDPTNILGFACTHLPIDIEEKYALLSHNDLKTRAFTLLTTVNTMLQLLEMKATIAMKTRSELDKQQKEYYLQQQMRVIREELNDGGDDDDIAELKKKASKIKWPKGVYATVKKEIKKLERLNIQSPDYSIQLQYLQTVLDIPWDKVTQDNFDTTNAAKVLDKDHFGLEKVKERILEHLAVLKLKGDLRSPIICLYGPPGVGKTSLGQSIAKALNRKYVRVSLGGLHDEAEIRGHRRTYIGAMPGRIIKGLIKAEAANPVFVLDEIDKLASDYKGDPSSALLEVLDPEQNNTFHDNYLDIDYDLSKVLFVATANNIGAIPGPLRDRMEMIEVGGYILEEKLEIAKRHLIPRALEAHGLKAKQVKIPKNTLSALIQSYTKESGVRELEKRLAALMRKVAKEVAAQIDRAEAGEEADSSFVYTITPDKLQDMLGAAKYSTDLYEGNSYAGVVTGLAWTSVGGEILMVESAMSPSRNGKMTITGNLGDVMKESALLALEYIKSHSDLYDIPKELFEYWNVHIHVPEGAIPKDGPSAGITLVTSLISTFTQRKVKSSIAMTGEITLRGKVLPVGGIKEKILAAKRSGIKTIILCSENKKDIDEIKEIYLKGLSFVYVDDITDVITHALSKEKVSSPINYMEHIKNSEIRFSAPISAK